jgi:hypothetical protein
MKKHTLLIITLLIGVTAFGQSKPKKKPTQMTDWVIMDSTHVREVTVKIACIAYTSFDNGNLKTIQADTIVKKYEQYYPMKWDGKLKEYTLSFFSRPMGTLKSDGSVTYENEVTYWYKGKQINPVEIITKPIIK